MELGSAWNPSKRASQCVDYAQRLDFCNLHRMVKIGTLRTDARLSQERGGFLCAGLCAAADFLAVARFGPTLPKPRKPEKMADSPKAGANVENRCTARLSARCANGKTLHCEPVEPRTGHCEPVGVSGGVRRRGGFINAIRCTASLWPKSGRPALCAAVDLTPKRGLNGPPKPLHCEAYAAQSIGIRLSTPSAHTETATLRPYAKPGAENQNHGRIPEGPNWILFPDSGRRPLSASVLRTALQTVGVRSVWPIRCSIEQIESKNAALRTCRRRPSVAINRASIRRPALTYQGIGSQCVG